MEQNRKVKFMKKKLSLILCLCFMALGLAACGTDPTTVDYFGMTYDELQSSMEQEVSALVGLTDDNRTYIQSYGSDTAMKLVESWDEATSDVGAYQGLGEFNITKAQKTLTVDQYVEYQNREVIVSYIYTYNYETEQPELTDASGEGCVKYPDGNGNRIRGSDPDQPYYLLLPLYLCNTEQGGRQGQEGRGRGKRCGRADRTG